MSLVCILCKNKNYFRSYLRYYKDTFEEIRRNDSLADPTKFTYSHVICSSFFTELELEMLLLSQQQDTLLPQHNNLPSPDKTSLVMEAIICNAKNLRENVMDDCSSCRRPINGYFLIPCLVKGCKNFYHYHCTKGRSEIQRVKLVKADNTTFKYGFFCSAHAKVKRFGTDITLRTNEFKVFKNLEEAKFEAELLDYEEMLLQNQHILKNNIDVGKVVTSRSVSASDKNAGKAEQSGNGVEITLNGGLNHNKTEQATPSTVARKEGYSSVYEYDTFGDFYNMCSDDEEDLLPAQSKVFDDNWFLQAQQEDTGEDTLDKEEEKTKEVIEELNDSLPQVHDVKNGGMELELEQRKDERDASDKIEEDFDNPKKMTTASMDGGIGTEVSSNAGNVEVTNGKGISSLARSVAGEDVKLGDSLKQEQLLQIKGPNLRPKKPLTFFNKGLGEETTKYTLKALNKKPTQKAKEKSKGIEERQKQPLSEDYVSKNKVFWAETSDMYFRKAKTAELEALKTTNMANPTELIRAEIKRAYGGVSEEAKKSFVPTFEVSELRSSVGQSMIPAPLDMPDTLKVLFEFFSQQGGNSKEDKGFQRSSHTALIGYFRMKMKGQVEMKMPASIEKGILDQNPKYNILPASKFKDLYAQFQESLKPVVHQSKFKYYDQTIEDENLDSGGYHKLFGLKHINYLSTDELFEIKAKAVLHKEIAGMEGTRLDELTRELIFYNYLLYQFAVPECNIRKERIERRLKEDDANQTSLSKLEERARKLDSELKYGIIKKFFRLGFQDKNKSSISQMYSKNSEEGINAYYGTALPKAAEVLGTNERMIKLVNSIDVQFRSTLSRIIRKNDDTIETDCCICFHNYSNDNNPIIYCSGGCGAGFHQYCYGIAELPFEDLYCDICLNSSTTKKQKSSSSQTKTKKSSGKDKLKKTDKKVLNEIRCKICNIEEFPLRNFKKEWYHITCLMLHDMVYYKNGKFFIKPEKSVPPIKPDEPETICSICNLPGMCIKCEEKECGKTWHALCAYLEGYKAELIDSNESKDDMTKNGFVPKIWCPDHCPDKTRDVLVQKYYRRFSTNYKNAVQYETFESYVKSLDEEMEVSSNQCTSQSQENLSAFMNVNIIVPNLIEEEGAKRKADILIPECDEEEDEELKHEVHKKMKLG